MLGCLRLSTRTAWVYRNRMTDSDKQARLAEALRANLRKRKAQSREMASAERDSGDPQIVAVSQKAADSAS